ncbi:MAG: hypothetical protein LBC73_07590 [Oscillospiraceae bacterium]|jgi:hypothetical protein|nr:hypothetical protein [Oscillospiraceae bacterium]
MTIKMQGFFEKKIVKWLFMFSGVALTAICLKDAKHSVLIIGHSIGIPVAICAWYYLFVKKSFLIEIFSELNKKVFIFSLLTSISAMHSLMTSSLMIHVLKTLFSLQSVDVTNHIPPALESLVPLLRNFILNYFSVSTLYVFGIVVVTLISCLAFPCIFVCMYKLWNVVYKKTCVEIKIADKIEKLYFLFSVMVFTVLILVLYNKTTSFSEGINYIYSADSLYFLGRATFRGQLLFQRPLFEILYLPIYSIIYPISRILFFSPRAIYFLIQFVHIILIVACAIMQSRFLKLSGISKTAFLVITSVTYPFIIFAFTIEQYVFSIFLLNLFLYTYLENKENKENLYIAATGALITTGVLLPLIIKGKTLMDKVSCLFFDALKALIVFSVFGVLTTLIYVESGLNWFLRFSTPTKPISEKILYFLNFVKECVIAPDGFVMFLSLDSFSSYVYWAADTTSVDYIGLSLLILALLGFAFNYNDRFSQICIGWIVFGFFIVGIFGYGLEYHETFLYSLYFGWAYIALLFKLIDKILSKTHNAVKISVYATIIITLCIVNIPEFINVINFGLEFYPVS